MTTDAKPPRTPSPSPQKRDEGEKRAHPFNAFALIVIAVLVAVGWYLIQTLSSASRSQDCIQSGRKNCAPIDESTVK